MRQSLVTFGLLLLAGCGGAPPAGEEEGPRFPVSVVAAQRQPVEETVRALARIEAMVEPVVLAETSGRVVAVHAEPGQAVDQGALLVELDDQDQRLALERAEAQLARVEALLAQQERQVARLRNLARRDATSEQALEQALAEQAALSAQRRELLAASAAAELALKRTRIESPVAGVVDRRLVSEGDYLLPGKPVVSLVGSGGRRVVLALPETLAPRLRPGLELRLFPAGAQMVVTSLAALRPAITPAGRAIEAIAHLEGPDAERLRPGARLEAELVLERRESFWLPALAVVERQEGTTVYVAEAGRARARRVEIGVRRAGFVEVRSGIEPGEPVIVEGAGFLTDGARVDVREGAS
jgi:RND family efflux transporter MFP subunit